MTGPPRIPGATAARATPPRSNLAQEFLSGCADMGVSLVTGVPCSRLSGLLSGAGAASLRYVAATGEGEAAAIAAGAWLGGDLGLVLTQSSGLGNMVNPLVTLHAVFEIPALLVVSVRGDPAAPRDEPQHRLMGAITAPLLDLMRIPWEDFPATAGAVAGAIERARAAVFEHRKSYGFLVRPGAAPGAAMGPPDRSPAAVVPAPISKPPARRSTDPATLGRSEAIAAVKRALRPSDLVIAATGYIARELGAQGDGDAQLYMVGSMGCAAGIALGVGLTRPERRVVVLDGDGAVLMRMGTLATIGACRPGNLVHVILDDGRYASTGGQPTSSATADLSRVAAACGYRSVVRAARGADVEDAVRRADRGPRLVHVAMAADDAVTPPRPDVAPPQVAARFRRLCRDGRTIVEAERDRP